MFQLAVEKFSVADGFFQLRFGMPSLLEFVLEFCNGPGQRDEGLFFGDGQPHEYPALFTDKKGASLALDLAGRALNRQGEAADQRLAGPQAALQIELGRVLVLKDQIGNMPRRKRITQESLGGAINAQYSAIGRRDQGRIVHGLEQRGCF